MESSIAEFLLWLLACELQPTFVEPCQNLVSSGKGLFQAISRAPCGELCSWCHLVNFSVALSYRLFKPLP